MRGHHYRPTGRSAEIQYIPTTRTCTGCQGALARPHATLSHINCTCPEGGHYRWTCFGCGAITIDPPCELGAQPLVVEAGDYFGGWSNGSTPGS